MGMVAVAEIPVEFRARYQDATQAWQLAQHLAAYQSTDRFLTDTEFCCTAFHVESLAFDCCCCIHIRSFTKQQTTTHGDFTGVVDTQNAVVTRTLRRAESKLRPGKRSL